MANILASKVGALVAGSPRDGIKWLYEALSVLDAKAQGLLRFNGLVMTLIGIFLAYSKDKQASIAQEFMFGVLSIFVIQLISSVLCFLIIRIQWEFLENLSTSPTPSEYEVELEKLARVAMSRTGLYKAAWMIGGFGFVSISLVAVYAGLTIIWSR